MELEPEIKIMNEIYRALEGLNEDARERVIKWIIEKFSLNIQRNEHTPSLKHKDVPSLPQRDLKSFNSVADIFSQIHPNTDAEKVLLAASYIQEMKSGEELTAREINMKLNLLGHNIRNITSTIGILINKRPQLMIQTRKEGKTKQAQKRYRVTEEGIIAAHRMIK